MSFDGLFDNLEAQGSASFILTGVKVRGDKDVVLIGTHAGHGNKGWQNARRRIDAKLKGRSGTPTGPELVDALTPPFAQFVLTGWENVFDENGKASTFSASEAVKLLNALSKKAPDIVDQAIGYFGNPINFRDTQDGAAEALGKE